MKNRINEPSNKHWVCQVDLRELDPERAVRGDKTSYNTAILEETMFHSTFSNFPGKSYSKAWLFFDFICIVMDFWCPPIVTREEWNALPAKNITELGLPTPHITLGQTALTECLTYETCVKEVVKIQKSHMNTKDIDDIGANFLICGEGTIFEGVGWMNQGRFRSGWNSISQSIYFLGPYGEDTGHGPPPPALASARELIRCGVESGFVDKNYTVYGNWLNPQVPIDCDCGPIDHRSLSLSTSTPAASFATTAPSSNLNSNVYLYGVGGLIGFAILLGLLFMWIWNPCLREKVRLRCAWALIHYEIPPKNISLVDPRAGNHEPLGKGNSGVVVKGRLIDWEIPDLKTTGSIVEKPGKDQFVAVKLLPDLRRSESVMNNFAQEMEMLMKVGRHVNIVNFIGVVLVGEPMIVMEYCSLGSLDKFLRNSANNRLSGLDATYAKYEYFGSREDYRPSCCDLESRYMAMERTPDNQIISSVDDLIHFGYQISRGMNFVFSRNMIHRDLAARNILLNSAMTVKIADFGMARENSEYIMQSDNVELPLRWLAPESIMRRGSYNVKSDVWSFGVTLWEILSLGRTPYEEELPKLYSCEQLRTFLATNGRLRQPIRACDTVYGIMQQCWAKEPADRPFFAELTEQLGRLLPPHLQLVYLKLDEENSAFNEKLDKDYYLTHL